MSIGVVLVTHHRLGEEFLKAMQQIVPGAPDFHAVAIEPGQSIDAMRKEIDRALTRADEGQGVLVLTDMFGGTPSNISLSFLDGRRVEVVTGVNLPMLIKLATLREEKELEDLAVFVKDYGRRNISVARQILSEKGS